MIPQDKKCSTSVKKLYSRRSILRAAIIGSVLPLVTSENAFPWGSTIWNNGMMKTPGNNLINDPRILTSTHKYLKQAAWLILDMDPAFHHMRNTMFANRKLVLQFDFMVAPSFCGKGPDARGNSRQSYHYYNPKLKKGLAIEKISESYMYMVETFLKRIDNPDPSGAADVAHFTAEICNPYHVLGTDSQTAGQYDRDRKFMGKVKLPQEVYGSLILDNDQYQHSGNFTNELSRFLIDFDSNNNNDWFDPWYYSGKYYNSNLSSHVIWEAKAYNIHPRNAGEQYAIQASNVPACSGVFHGGFDPTLYVDKIEKQKSETNTSMVSEQQASSTYLSNGPPSEMEDGWTDVIGGEQPSHSQAQFGMKSSPVLTKKPFAAPKEYDSLWPGNGVPALDVEELKKDRQVIMQKYLHTVALRTFNTLPQLYMTPERALINAVSVIATVWRSSFSGLVPSVKIKKEGDMIRIWPVVHNATTVPAVGCKVHLNVEHGTIVEGKANFLYELDIPAKTKSVADTSCLIKPQKGREKFVAAHIEAGAFIAIPDLQYARVVVPLYNDYPRVYEGIGTFIVNAYIKDPKTSTCKSSRAKAADYNCKIIIKMDERTFWPQL